MKQRTKIIIGLLLLVTLGCYGVGLYRLHITDNSTTPDITNGGISTTQDVTNNGASTIPPITDFDDGSDNLSDGEGYVIQYEQPARYNFAPSKSITAYEMAMILKEGELSFYLSGDEYSKFPQGLKKYLQRED